MSKKREETTKVDPTTTERIEKLTERASAIGAPVSKLIAGGFLDEAEVLIGAIEGKKTAEETASRSGRSANRFDLFYRKINGPLSKGELPTGTEDREYFYGLRDLYPREGRGGGSSDWSSKGVAKSLAVLSSLGALNADYEADYRAIVGGTATEGKELPNRKFKVPDKVATL